MLILIILLGVLLIGIVCFIAGQLWEQRLAKRARAATSSVSTRTRSLITKELDELLLVYQRGLLTEEQYASSTDKLVDELSALLTDESPLTGQPSVSYRASSLP